MYLESHCEKSQFLYEDKENYSTKRNSWDTCIKHYYRLGLEDCLPYELKSIIPSSNISRWKLESDSKYKGHELAEFIKHEIELIKRINQSSNIKIINESYFELCDTYHKVISNIKGIKSVIKENKDLVINTIEKVKDYIPINTALKVFNISRSTYQHYKSIVIHKCDASYFKWCVKRFPNQLLPKEVETIKTYLTNTDFMYWSKSSVYLRAVRDNKVHCCISTFYKYCRLLGFENLKNQSKSKFYNPLKTTKPNEVWCADVTIFKTGDAVKHYIHVLMDHYSKRVLGYSIQPSSSGKAIRELLHDAYYKYRPNNSIFLTDAGSENVNTEVSALLNSWNNCIVHRIAQRDVLFSNSMIEAFNKVLKHQFLYPKHLNSKTQLIKALDVVIPTYNNIRPQWSLGGNTPDEIFNGKAIKFNTYKTLFKEQKVKRLIQNKKNTCRLSC